MAALEHSSRSWTNVAPNIEGNYTSPSLEKLFADSMVELVAHMQDA